MARIVFIILFISSVSSFADGGKGSLQRKKVVSPTEHIDTSRSWTIDVLEIRQGSDSGDVVFEKSGSAFSMLKDAFNSSPIELPSGDYYVKFWCHINKTDLVSAQLISLLDDEHLEINTKSKNFNCNVWYDTKDGKYAAEMEKNRNEVTKKNMEHEKLEQTRNEWLKPKTANIPKQITTSGLDSAGRKVISGPVGSGNYDNVHIVSNSIGVAGESAITITNSVIDAPVCVRTSGFSGLTMTNNSLNCRLAVEFTGNMLTNNVFLNNTYTGAGTNRPEILGW